MTQIGMEEKGGARGFFDRGGKGPADKAEQGELAELWLHRAMVQDDGTSAEMGGGAMVCVV